MKNRFFWIVALAGLALDQLTKLWTSHSFQQLGETVPLLPGIFHLTYVHNTGAAFSLFTGGADWLRWLSLLVSLGLMTFAVWGPHLRLLEQLSYGAILAGAVGNGICRFLYGYVIDFLDFRWINFPVFNFADVWINLGIMGLLIVSFVPTSGEIQPKSRSRKKR